MSPYVKQAQKDGYRSRASYKLIQLNEKDRLIRPGMLIVDLGSAPGGWSQVAARLVGDKGRVLATDILPMDPLPNVDFVQGDFTEEPVLKQVLDWLGDNKPDVVLSDIAPNISGIDSADQASSMYLVEARPRHGSAGPETQGRLCREGVPRASGRRNFSRTCAPRLTRC